MNWKLLLIALTLILGISARPADETIQESTTVKAIPEVTITERPTTVTESPIEIVNSKKIVEAKETSTTAQVPTTTTIRYLASQSLQTKPTNANKKKYSNNYANLITKHSQRVNNKMPNTTVDNGLKSSNNKDLNINYSISSDSANAFNLINVTSNKNEQLLPIATISSPTTSNSSSKPLVFVDADVTFPHFSALATTKRAYTQPGNQQFNGWSNYNLEDTSENTLLTTRKKPVIHKIISKWSDNPNDVFSLHNHEPLVIPSKQAQLNELKNQIVQSAYKQQQLYQNQYQQQIFRPSAEQIYQPSIEDQIKYEPPKVPQLSAISFDNLPTIIGQQLIHQEQHLQNSPPFPNLPRPPPPPPVKPIIPVPPPIKPIIPVSVKPIIPVPIPPIVVAPTLPLKPTINNLLLLNKPHDHNSLINYCKNIRIKLGTKYGGKIDSIEQCKGLNIFIDNKIDNNIAQASTTADYEFPSNDKFEDPPVEDFYDALSPHQSGLIETEPDTDTSFPLSPTAVSAPDNVNRKEKSKNKKKKQGDETDMGSMIMTVMTMMAIFNPLNFGVWGIILAPVAAITLGGACFIMYQVMTNQNKEKHAAWQNPPPWPKPQEIIIRNKINHSAIPIKITHLHKHAQAPPQKVIYTHPPQPQHMPVMEYMPPWQSEPPKHPPKSYGEPPEDSYFPSAPSGGPYRRKTSMSKRRKRPNPFVYKLL